MSQIKCDSVIKAFKNVTSARELKWDYRITMYANDLNFLNKQVILKWVNSDFIGNWYHNRAMKNHCNHTLQDEWPSVCSKCRVWVSDHYIVHHATHQYQSFWQVVTRGISEVNPKAPNKSEVMGTSFFTGAQSKQNLCADEVEIWFWVNMVPKSLGQIC